MDTQIFVRGAADPVALREFSQEKLDNTLNRFQDRILSAKMWIEDETGPEKSGVDKNCNIEVHLRTGAVRIKERGEEFHATIDKAIDRLKAALSREAGRAKRGIGEG